MKKKVFFIMALPSFLLHANAVFAQTKTKVEGVWKITQVILTFSNVAGKDSTITVNNPQPDLIIFTKGYCSLLAVRRSQPRTAVAPAKDPQKLTDDEKIARYEEWSEFTANSGTYEIKGSTIIRHPIVAKSVNVMTTGTPINSYEFKLEGDNTLWLSTTRSTTEPGVKAKWTRVD